MLSLRGHRRDVSIMCRSLLLRCRARTDPTVAAVVTHAVYGDISDRCVVNVMDVGDVNVGHGSIVEKAPIIPTPAFVSVAEGAETVIDSAVKAYLWSPIAFIENKAVATPAPISWRPQEADFWRLHPCTGHPVIIAEIFAVGPVTRRPDIAVARASWLFIDGQSRWSKRNRDTDLRNRRCGDTQQGK